MNTYLHGMSTLSVLIYGEKRVKDLVIGDRVLCSYKGQDVLSTITNIITEDYNNWSKITYSNGQEVIFDREVIFTVNQEVESLLDENIVIINIKDYNKTSKAYKITLEDSFDFIYTNDISIKRTYE